MCGDAASSGSNPLMGMRNDVSHMLGGIMNTGCGGELNSPGQVTLGVALQER